MMIEDLEEEPAAEDCFACGLPLSECVCDEEDDKEEEVYI